MLGHTNSDEPSPTKLGVLSRGRNLGRNPDKSLKSFLLAIQTPLQLGLEISISSNSRNLLHISSNSYNLLRISSNSCNILHIFSNSRNLKSISSNSNNLKSISTVQLLYTKQEKGGKPYPLPYGLEKPNWNLKFEKEIVRSWIRLLLTGAKPSISALSFCLSGFSFRSCGFVKIKISFSLKVHKNENFFGSDFEFWTISLLVMLK